jgi:DUF1680 family protein
VSAVNRHATVSINGRSVSAVPDAAGYVSLDRQWKNGDVIDVELPVDVRRVVANQRVPHNRGRVAIERGPLVYCAEWPEVEGGRVLDLLLDPDASFEPSRTQHELPQGDFRLCILFRVCPSSRECESSRDCA